MVAVDRHPHAPSSGARNRRELAALRQRQQQSEHALHHKPKEMVDEKGVPYATAGLGASKQSTPWLPRPYTAFKLLLTVRLSSAFWSMVADCDETFNYWEPAHFLAFGRGMQTWEYDPKFGLRSYLYLLVHVVPALLYDMMLSPHRMYLFFLVRCLLALLSSVLEVFFYQAVAKEVGVNVGRLTLAFLVFGAGMFSSSTAFLPSSTSMLLTFLMYGAWFERMYGLAIFATALSTFLSWPFAVLLGIPIALDLLFRQKRVHLFIRWSVISAVVILLPQTAVDSYYYGRLVSAPFNIVKYNVLSTGSDGPNLYGTEPWHFYGINAFLNFNFAFILALMVVPLKILAKTFISSPGEGSKLFIPHWIVHLGLYLWLLVFGLQPHKEERFLYPAYPLLCMAAASSLDQIQKLAFYAFVRTKRRHYLDHFATKAMAWVLLGAYGLMSLSRVLALYHNYHAPMDIWMRVSHLPDTHPEVLRGRMGAGLNVCVGKEWHRFPSSFFLPNDWKLKFVKSEFSGQLPQPFAYDERQQQSEEDFLRALRLSRDTFNDGNREESNRYVKDVLKECDFMVDLSAPLDETDLEPDYAGDDKNWAEEFAVDFLDAKRSHRLFRSFHVPVVGNSYLKYNKYVLLRNKEKGRPG